MSRHRLVLEALASGACLTAGVNVYGKVLSEPEKLHEDISHDGFSLFFQAC